VSRAKLEASRAIIAGHCDASKCLWRDDGRLLPSGHRIGPTEGFARLARGVEFRVVELSGVAVIMEAILVGRWKDQENLDAVQGSALHWFADSQWVQQRCRSGRKHLVRPSTAETPGRLADIFAQISVPTAKMGRFPLATCLTLPIPTG